MIPGDYVQVARAGPYQHRQGTVEGTTTITIGGRTFPGEVVVRLAPSETHIFNSDDLTPIGDVPALPAWTIHGPWEAS